MLAKVAITLRAPINLIAPTSAFIPAAVVVTVEPRQKPVVKQHNFQEFFFFYPQRCQAPACDISDLQSRSQKTNDQAASNFHSHHYQSSDEPKTRLNQRRDAKLISLYGSRNFSGQIAAAMASARALARLAPQQARLSQVAQPAMRLQSQYRYMSMRTRRPVYSTPVTLQSQLQIQRRLESTEAPAATLSPQQPPKKKFRKLRFLWRLIQLSLIGGLGYTAYSIYQERHPDEPADPDPNRKTLVILGKSDQRVICSDSLCMQLSKRAFC